MNLYLDTTDVKKIQLALYKDNSFSDDSLLNKKDFEIKNKRQAEELLISINKFLKINNLKWKDVKSLKVNNVGGSFTGLRLGVIVFNTLSWSLGIPVYGKINEYEEKNGVKMIKPLYDREPDIVVNKNKYNLN
ncbi:hypothetical protein EOL94_00525 [bacterium]|nr:hypothetical protein [bacterium]